MNYQKDRHAAARHRRQGIRHRLFPRLGRQGHVAAGREGGDRRKLRAHSSLQPDRHGRAAAEFLEGEDAGALGLTGKEVFPITGLNNGDAREVAIEAKGGDGKSVKFKARVRLDTPKERDYYKNGGILQYVLRNLAAPDRTAKNGG